MVKTLADFVAAARDPAHAAHADVIGFFRASFLTPVPVVFEVAGFDALRTCSRPEPLRLGDLCFFLASQLGYLEGFRTGADELHTVCTERFDADWAALASRFRVKRRPVRRRHARNASSATMSESDAAFVRECLFPWDAELHSELCGRREGPHPVDA